MQAAAFIMLYFTFQGPEEVGVKRTGCLSYCRITGSDTEHGLARVTNTHYKRRNYQEMDKF